MPISHDELRTLARNLAIRYFDTRSGTPKHRLLAELSHRRTVIKDLLEAGLMRWHGTTAFPTFQAFELLGADHRNTCRSAVSYVFTALRSHFAENGPVPAKADQILAYLHDPSITREHIQLGVHIAAEFHYLIAGHSELDDGTIESVTPKEEILDFTTIEVALAKETMWRREQTAQPTVPEKASTAPRQRHELDFTFVTDARLRAIIERDYTELQSVKHVGATLSRMVLSGRIIEGLLLDAVLRHSSKARCASKAPKDKGQVKPFEKWALNDLLDVALELGFVRSGHEKQSHGVREYRNLIHPGWELRSDLVVRENEANIAEEFLNIVVLDLPDRSK